MRSWKNAETLVQRVFLYFRAHPETYFTVEHVVSQVKHTKNDVRRVIKRLCTLGKLDRIETMSAKKWGRSRWMYRAIRTADDSVDQLEVFQDAVTASDVYAAFERRKP